MDDTSLLEIFREESLERVDRMAATLLAAEADGGGAEAIAELFRDAHSIKGSAGMFGLDQIGALAGAMEEVLARSREGGALGPRAIPALLGGADAIRAAVSDDLRRVAPAAAALLALGTAEQPVRERRSATERTLRVRAEKVDRLLATVAENAMHGRRVEHLTASASEPLREELERGRTLVSDLQDAVLDLRTLPLDTIVGGLTRAVRDTAAEAGREVRLEFSGTDTPLDRTILDGIGDALVHLLRNAVSHGIEPPAEREWLDKPRTGTVRIDAEQRGGLVALTCADDGRGVAPDVLARVRPGGSLADVLAEPGFSTADGVSELAGRGVGLDAVKRHVEGLGGVLEVTSEPGKGTTVTLLVPFTLAVITVLLFTRGRQVFGVPLSGVDRAVRGPEGLQLHGRRALDLDGITVPLTDLADAIGVDAPGLRAGGPVVVLTSGSRRAAVECDRLLGDREVVVKSLGPLLAHVPGYLGAAILGDGGIALLLDPAHLVRTAEAAPRTERGTPVEEGRPAPLVLVVDDQFTVRELERTILEAAGYRVRTAEDGRAALAVLDAEPDVECVVSDIEMPRMGGLDLLEAIRARPALASLPVVIVTSRDDDAALERGADAGADAWVVKSQFEQQALLETVGRLVGLR